jgi:DUF4097 and DUF4098 domain-containing protein YvlB
MRFLFSKFVVALLIAFASANVFAQKKSAPINKDLKEETVQKKGEASIATSPNVAVVFCGGSGRVNVRGWDKAEVRAVSEKGTKISLVVVRADGKSSPVTQVRIMIVDEDSDEDFSGSCFSNSNLDLYVPRGAYIDLQTREGDINAEKVAKARLKSLNGSFYLREISALAQVESTSGDISIDNSSGQIVLSAISGSIDVRNVKPSEAGDSLLVTSISGDVNLDRVNFLRVEGGTVSGDVTLFGALTKGATYTLRTTSGDVTTVIPPNSSFKVIAAVSINGEIISDFPITKTTNTATRTTTRLVGTHGTADSTLNLTAINGTIHIRKK